MKKIFVGRTIGKLALVFALILLLSGCVSPVLIRRIIGAGRFDLRQKASEISQVIMRKDIASFLKMTSPELHLSEQDIGDFFDQIKGQIEKFDSSYIQKHSSGGKERGKYYEQGYLRFYIVTNSAEYDLTMEYTYYSELFEKIGITGFILKQITGEDEKKKVLFEVPVGSWHEVVVVTTSKIDTT
jgi:hypothetical protein